MFLAIPAYAQCPLCVVTVGGGMLLAKKLGVDDLLVSIWISALNTAIAFWLAPKLKLKWLKNGPFLSILFLIFTLTYFQFTGQTGHLSNKILGFDKIFLGQSLGLFVMFFGNWLYVFTKKKNGDKTIFPYARVVFPFASVLVTTLIFKLAFKL